MVGGHFDTWQPGAGATDNAAGSAVAMEALRILKTLGVKPRRTIRIGIVGRRRTGGLLRFDGLRETSLRRSGADATASRAREFSAYFNVDHGTGKIRGFYLQGNAAARPILAAFLEPFRDLGASTLSLAN